MTDSTTEWIDPAIHSHMQHFFQTLSEKDQRRYAALEARRLGHGGITCVARLLGCSTKTISRGLEELEALPEDPAAGRIRRPGAGRKKPLPRTPQPNNTSNP